jgi:hypothetical protein
LEAYDIEIPVFVIDVQEDMWNLYIIFSRGSTSNDLVFLGPYSMEDTKSHQGIFKIVHVLSGVVEWGNMRVETSSYIAPCCNSHGRLTSEMGSDSAKSNSSR